MSTTFEDIAQKLDKVLQVNRELLSAIERRGVTPYRVPFSEFCKEQNISRPTGYSWADKGLIRMEKIGGRQYVSTESIITKPREPAVRK
jgi:hypothetical protein